MLNCTRNQKNYLNYFFFGRASPTRFDSCDLFINLFSLIFLLFAFLFPNFLPLSLLLSAFDPANLNLFRGGLLLLEWLCLFSLNFFLRGPSLLKRLFISSLNFFCGGPLLLELFGLFLLNLFWGGPLLLEWFCLSEWSVLFWSFFFFVCRNLGNKSVNKYVKINYISTSQWTFYINLVI